MRKQTKVVAVASAAALLAIGASMTSFAATGWVEEDGTWYFYDKDGNRVEDTWKKSGDNWYWLDSEEGGAMAMDKLVEDDDDLYYVDSNGVMVRNTWVKIVNEEQDDDEDPAEYIYYYMQSNGKAYKTGNSNDNTKFKTIDGKRYAFDGDGKMLYGWVNGQSERISDEDGWAETNEDVYYLGNWDDGAMKTGWQKINVYDDGEDENMDYWFYFKSNGKRFYNDESTENNVKDKKINGKKYGFDSRGVMVYEWMIASGASSSSATVSNWQYFNNPEDGARVTKGWFRVVAPNEDNTFNSETYSGTFATEHADDESEKWYYADGNGELYEGAIKKIKGKYYGFRPASDSEKGAAMLNGLCLLTVEGDEIKDVIEEDMDADTLNDIIDEDGDFDRNSGEKYGRITENTTLYYFGNDEVGDGSMRTGAATINLDSDSYSFLFSKSGGAERKGRGLTGIDDEKYIYKYGMRIKADSDDKYRVVAVIPGVYVDENGVPVTDKDGNKQYGGVDTSSKGVTVRKLDSSALRELAMELGTNKNGDTVNGVVNVDEDKKEVKTTWGSDFYLVNTAGSISKKKTAAKDGADWYFYVNSDKEIVMYLNNKTYKGDKDHDMEYDLDNWDKVK